MIALCSQHAKFRWCPVQYRLTQTYAVVLVSIPNTLVPLLISATSNSVHSLGSGSSMLKQLLTQNV